MFWQLALSLSECTWKIKDVDKKNNDYWLKNCNDYWLNSGSFFEKWGSLVILKFNFESRMYYTFKFLEKTSSFPFKKLTLYLFIRFYLIVKFRKLWTKNKSWTLIIVCFYSPKLKSYKFFPLIFREGFLVQSTYFSKQNFVYRNWKIWGKKKTIISKLR